jgi:ribose-phosphate pyrophosphokinase
MRVLCSECEIICEESVFPGGEVHVKILNPDEVLCRAIHIIAILKNSDDIFKLLVITDALKREGATGITLNIPYLPYARQDRVCNRGEALSLRVMCDLINSQNYEKVHISNAHSDVALALINNVRHESAYVPRCAMANSVLVAPDSGSLKKVSSIADLEGIPFIRADKRRLRDGAWETTVYSEHVGNKNLLIVDDICDGGKTFVELAKKLKPLTNGEVNLYVTHGIFSKGMVPFSGLIDKVYCSYPWIFEDIFEEEGFFNVNERLAP